MKHIYFYLEFIVFLCVIILSALLSGCNNAGGTGTKYNQPAPPVECYHGADTEECKLWGFMPQEKEQIK